MSETSAQFAFAVGVGKMVGYDVIWEQSMGTVRRTITFTELHDEWIKAQIAAGHYTNDSEYIRNLIRRDRQRTHKYETLKTAIQEGLDSGPSDKTVSVIMDEVEARLRSNGRLQAPVESNR